MNSHRIAHIYHVIFTSYRYIAIQCAMQYKIDDNAHCCCNN